MTGVRTYAYTVPVMETPRHFDKIRDFYRAHRRMPSHSEIARAAGLSSKGSTHKLVNRLVELGLVERDETGRLLPGRRFHSVTLLGAVSAGWPSPAEEELLDTMTLDEFLVERPGATFMLKVQGDSMIDAGIMPGDMVLVERGVREKDGDIIIAEVDGEWTMKYFRQRGGKVYLEAANRRYKPIYPEKELRAAAVVKAVIRKY
ncbi:lexA repressor [bacterium BMS3Abin01]|nr:lexA repressor [bacterium BMS3Abin01]